MSVLAIDPGNEQSAYVVLYDDGSIEHGMGENKWILALLVDYWDRWEGSQLAIEMIASYGMPVGREVFETCVWIGRFIERWAGPHTLVYRQDVKLHLCGTARAKDANVRQALIDRYGDSKQKAIGLKATPGPLYGVKKDIWAALAVAVTYADTIQARTAA